ncbi:unnamed protein product [Brachionus calyciflorus]|uniref:TLDc domain-containing protein n=1 Tax=Brachionus calyciflorus TaxID=104777 RepID=A0A814NZ71_9BILA|nr:unnamed protein product [Brachionus calyciflorus]
MSDESKLIQKHFVKMIEQFKYSKSEIIESAGSLEKPEIIKLNIGGTIFSTLKSTLTKQIRDKDGHSYPPNIFESILEGYSKPILDENEAIFIDRSPKYFDHILDYLRNVDFNNNYTLTEDVDLDELNQEAKYYNLEGLEKLTSKVTSESISEKNDKEILKIDSVILNEQQIKDLYKLCEFPKAKFELLYRASRDGFSTNNFHENCDNIPFTLTVIKTTTGDIFGGFTEEEWTNHPCSKTGPNAFIFSLKNDENTYQDELYEVQ